MSKFYKSLRYLALLGGLLILSGCDKLVVLNSKGSVGKQEADLIITSFLIMMIIVIPTIILTFWYAFKYREGNKKATYDPTFVHSNKIEFFMWGIPCVIVVFLAILAYKTSHDLDPYKPLESDKKAIEIQAVALPWKWLFIYPEQGIATVNEIYFPKDTPVNFKISADAPMNSFFIPQLAGQVYAMSGMQTQLHLDATEAGVYRGMSANYSGAGFANMHFKAHVTETEDEFNEWLNSVKASGNDLNDAVYEVLAREDLKVNQEAEAKGLHHEVGYHPVTYYSSVKPNLFMQIMMQYPMAVPKTSSNHHESH